MNTKKNFFVCITLCLLLILCAGCGGEKTEDTVKTVSKNGIEYTVDTEKCTISDGWQTYPYIIDASGTTFQYPDGESFTWKETSNGGVGMASPEYDASTYADPWILRDVIEDVYQPSSESGHANAGIGIILLVIGIADAVWPDKVWFLNGGWRYKDAEPSDTALGVYRVGGIAAALVGIILILV